MFVPRALYVVINSSNRSALRNCAIGALIRHAPADVPLQGNARSSYGNGCQTRGTAGLLAHGKVTSNKIPDIRQLLMPRRNAKRHLHRHFISTRVSASVRWGKEWEGERERKPIFFVLPPYGRLHRRPFFHSLQAYASHTQYLESFNFLQIYKRYFKSKFFNFS